MSEILHQQHDNGTTEQASPSAEDVALQESLVFLTREIPALQKLTGIRVGVSVGNGWSTDLESGSFTIDPSFFSELGYSAEHCVYATLHEIMAHVRDVKLDPVLAARQRNFMKRSQADHLFVNILTDIIGNKRIHRLLPNQAEIAADVYDTRLFPLEKDGETVDYSTLPLHLQFMYKMIRQEMIPGSDTPVRAEVDEALARLRDFKGMGDVIEFLTRPDEKIKGNDRFDKIIAIIYPVYKELLEQAKKESEAESSESGQSGESDSAQPGDKAGPGSSDPFAKDYEDYFETKHPEPMSEEQEEQLEKMIGQSIKDIKDRNSPPGTASKLDESLRAETGFGLVEHQNYQQQIDKYREVIDEMRDVFRQIIQERVALRRRLSRHAYSEGDILDPNRLTQLIIDKKGGVTEPEAFVRYEKMKSRDELFGNTDYIFVFDRSGSMSGERSTAAATSSLILLEALAGMERDIAEAEKQADIELDLDIRTALYVFSDTSECIKPLSSGLSDQQRMSVQQQIMDVNGSTADYLALEEIEQIPIEPGRRRIVMVISDGESNEPSRARGVVRRLRDAGVEVFGIGIGSDEVAKLYWPLGQQVDNPIDLPKILEKFVISTME